MRVVEVRWHDAWISTEDMSLKKARKQKPIVRSTTGFLIRDCPEWVILSTDRFEKGKEISAPMVIPKGMILDWWEYEDA